METNTVWVKLPLQCYACFNTCYYRFHLVRWAWKGAFGPPSEFITNSQFVLKYRCNLTSPKNLSCAMAKSTYPGLSDSQISLHAAKTCGSIIINNVKKNFSVVQKYAKKNYRVFSKLFKSELLYLKFSSPLPSRLLSLDRIGEKSEKKKKKRLLGKLLLLGQDYRWNLWRKNWTSSQARREGLLS